MHEYSVVTELVDALLPRLERHEGDIAAVYLKKGSLRILSDRALKNAFEVVAQGTRLEGASLEIEEIPARIACKTCAYEGPAEVYEDESLHFAVPVLSCPKCEGEVEIRAGRELLVDRVSIRSMLDEGA